MSDFVLSDIKRKLKIEQTVRDFFQVMEQQELTIEEGLVAWNMLGFTIFQDMYPEANHQEVHHQMIAFSNQLFESSQYKS